LCEHTFVRWDNLRIDGEEHASLPGYREPAVVRHFDAPEALDTRFYEVRAKSALNKVPERSRMPFRWTINPYRGCAHACVYCLQGDTRVLLANGGTKPIADLREGDAIYGTARVGADRWFVRTRVLAHWSSVKPAYRVMLADGTELVASADHRFLTGRGWKHVTGAERGAHRRPHLTAGAELLGTGRVAGPPALTDDYLRGYLCGLIRGDGLPRSYTNERGDRVHKLHRFRLALVDREALERAREYLLASGVETREYASQAATATTTPVGAVHAPSRGALERITELVAWPLSPCEDWRKGFLAGIFDAEGSCGSEALRIANTDPRILGWTSECLRHFGFDAVLETRRSENGRTDIRVRGGLCEVLRFFHTTEPAISRKRDLEGRAITTNAKLRVVSIEPLGKAMRLYDITTGTGDFIANGVVSHNCFARPTHTYLDMDAGRDFEREIVVKVNAPEVLRAELARPSWKGEHVAMGTNTDPYQWVEGRYKLMRGIWEALRDAANPCSVLTKSPLLLRDLDLMIEIARVTEIAANLSIPTMDEKPWRATEPHTPSPKARMEAVAELNRAGIPTGILVAPLMPGINDDPRQVERILEAAAEAGAVGVSGIALHLRGEVRQIFMDWLCSYRPDLVERYEEVYRRGAYAPREEQDRLRRLLRTTHSPAGREPPRRSPADSRGVRREAPGMPGDRSAQGTGAAGPVARPVRAGRQEALF
jgi:DNA repair photolyase